RQDLKKNNKRHPVRYVNGYWRMAYGAIHGLPTSKADIEKLQIGIFPEDGNPNEEVLLETVKVEKVLLKESVLKFKESDSNKTFTSELLNFPGAMVIGIKGSATNLKKFDKHYQKKPSAFLLLDKNATETKYYLEVKKDQLLVKYRSNDTLLHGADGLKEASVNYITETLEQIESWERLNNLQNEKSKIKKALEIIFVDESDEENPVETKDSIVTFDYPKKGEDKDEDGDLINLYYTIKARNTSSKKLYVALLHLNASFGINTFFPCGEFPPNSEVITLDNEHGLHIENENWNEVTDVFKIIVSTAPFDDYQFQQEAFERGVIEKSPGGKSTRGVSSRKKSETDWCTHSITVNTIRKGQTISNNDITFKKEKIKIKAHSSFTADVAFAPAKSGTRSVHPIAALSDIFNDEDYGLLNLSNEKSRSVQDKTIIELSGITNDKALKKNPLEIEVNQKLSEDEHLMPVSFDGEFIIPFGQVSKKEDGTSTIKIDKLPTSKDVNRKRSLTRAAWFCLLKVTGFRNKAFRLRVAQMNRKNKLVRNRAGINSKVASAKKILIIIHGIIGETNCVAENLLFLVDKDDDKKYDLMLTYDYENLNEPIEKIAEEFNKRLEELDLKPGQKQIDIVAHSMGGLVSRYMIEHIRKGDGLINRLIMLGTPNGGSPFGSIPEYLSILHKLTATAINFSKPFLKSAVSHLQALEKFTSFFKDGKLLLVTLDQMNPDSKFVKALFKNKKPNTKYYIIAGDITAYKSTADARFARFAEKVLLKIGDGMNQDLPNDIAVSVDQILDVPPKFKAKKYTTVGHHLNYFHYDVEGMEVLVRILMED
ncbi:MAG: lipase family alpha/beta hydrolase, partial [Saprospiraceae bacterium]